MVTADPNIRADRRARLKRHRNAGQPLAHRAVDLLIVYLALPFDLIPDFVPVLGYADDAIIVALLLRSATRSAEPGTLTKHWPGTAEGLTAMKRLCRLNGK